MHTHSSAPAWGVGGEALHPRTLAQQHPLERSKPGLAQLHVSRFVERTNPWMTSGGGGEIGAWWQLCRVCDSALCSMLRREARASSNLRWVWGCLRCRGAWLTECPAPCVTHLRPGERLEALYEHLFLDVLYTRTHVTKHVDIPHTWTYVRIVPSH